MAGKSSAPVRTSRRKREPKPLSTQPGHSWEFFYERLTEKEFQRLCGSVLLEQDENIRLYPVGMSDGGRDATSGREDGQAVIYQVKWTKDRQQNPVAWLTEAMRGEKEKIKRLVKEKHAKKYVLMTCVAGTAVYGSGGKDRFDAELDKLENELGIPMEVLWQDDLDLRVRRSREIKWAFPQMLAGIDAIRWWLENEATEGRMAEMRTALVPVLRLQRDEDSRVKFKQVDLDSTSLSDLFVDVELRTVSEPQHHAATGQSALDSLENGFQYLFRPRFPFTLVRGEPGQGKSTLGQYLCQVHRTNILDRSGGDSEAEDLGDIRIPIRLELRHYATWLRGIDPFDGYDAEKPSKVERRAAADRSLEQFLCDSIAYYSGGSKFTVENIRDLLERFPFLFLLDGLDEVGDNDIRREVCEQIEMFCKRRDTPDALRTQVVVTTRPSFSSQPEPSSTLFEQVRLVPLNVRLQRTYVDKWGRMKGMSSRERSKLKNLFNARTAEGFVAQLSANPMYLTILLYLLDKNSDAVPSGRSALYRAYLDALLAREVVREQIEGDEEHLDRIREVVSWLGWLMQSLVESDPGAGRMKASNIRGSIFAYLDSVQGPTDLAHQLFKDSSDRFWVLTSKEGDLFEFAIQPVREYFAASFLANYASLESGITKAEVLRNLVERPYWLNTALFFGGFANPNEVSGLVDGMKEAFDSTGKPRHLRVAHWALLGDGVFRGYAPAQSRAAGLLLDDLSLRLVDPRRNSEQFPRLPAKHGGQVLAEQLRKRITDGWAGEGASPVQVARVQLYSCVAPDTRDLTQWLEERLKAEAGGARSILTLQAALDRPSVRGNVADDLDLVTGPDVRAAIAAGVSPQKGTRGANQLEKGVLRGWASDSRAEGSSYAAALLRAFRPSGFIATVGGTGSAMNGHLQEASRDGAARLRFMNDLRRRDERFSNVMSTGMMNSTGNVSLGEWTLMLRRLVEITGPCWLVSELALMGVGSPSLGGTGQRMGEPCFGQDMNYTSYVHKMRTRHEEGWWREQFEECSDDVSRMAWSAGLLCVGEAPLVTALLPELTSALNDLNKDDYWAMAQGLSRLRLSGLVRRLPKGRGAVQNGSLPLGGLSDVANDPRTLALYSIFSSPSDKSQNLRALSVKQLESIADLDAASWPAHCALSARLIEAGSMAALDDLAIAGPSAVVAVPHEMPEGFRSDVVDALLADPFRYPLAWVLAAERWKSEMSHPRPLMEIAEEHRWVSSGA